MTRRIGVLKQPCAAAPARTPYARLGLACGLLWFGLAAHAQAPASPARESPAQESQRQGSQSHGSQTQDQPGDIPGFSAAPEYWWGTITVLAHSGAACSETSGGLTLPYSKKIRMQLQFAQSGHARGFAWGEMLPVRLGPLEIPASTQAGGVADVVVLAPPGVLGLTWLPARGSYSPGQLALSSVLVFNREGDRLMGRWRERIPAGVVMTEQCLWQEAQISLERLSGPDALSAAHEAGAVRQTLALFETQSLLESGLRWPEESIAALLLYQAHLPAGSDGAGTVLPMLSRLAEQLTLNRQEPLAKRVMGATLTHLEGLLQRNAIEYVAYVTHLTPVLRSLGMLPEAERLNGLARGAMQKQGQGHSPELARLLSGYGALLMRMKSNEQALHIYEQALAIERSVSQGRHIGVVIGLVNLSRICEVSGQRDRSIRLAEEASTLHEDLGLGPLKTAPSVRGRVSDV